MVKTVYFNIYFFTSKIPGEISFPDHNCESPKDEIDVIVE